LVKKKIVADHSRLQTAEKRKFHFVQTLIPYVWGYPQEGILQTDLYQYNNIAISSVKIKLERTSREYWFIAADLPQKFEEETTLIPPNPYPHDKFQNIQFNTEVTTAGFKENFSIFSSEFMHAYYLINKRLVHGFANFTGKDKWLSARKNNACILLPKNSIEYNINHLEKTQQQVGEEVTEAIRLAVAFEQMFF
jgi:hypothetical protein